MLLITAAYKNEVKSLLSSRPFQKVESNIYSSNMINIVISGEGADKVRRCCQLVENRLSQDALILLNIGVAGSLTKKFAPGDIVRVSQVTAESEGEFGVSYRLNTEETGVKCVSASNRVENAEYANRLAAKGEIVDRELWYWADWAMGKEIACRSIKIISDRAYAFPGTRRVIENMASFSERLADEIKQWPEWKL